MMMAVSAVEAAVVALCKPLSGRRLGCIDWGICSHLVTTRIVVVKSMTYRGVATYQAREVLH